MDLTYLLALATLCGSVCDTLPTVLTGWLSQRRIHVPHKRK